MTARLKQKLLLIAGLGVGGLFLWLSLRQVQLADVLESLEAARLVFAIPFLVALFLFYWLKADRWRILILPIKAVQTRRLFPVIMIGYAGSAILPMQLGEVVRTVMAARRFDIAVSATLATITVERLFDLLVVLMVVGLVLALGREMPPELSIAGYAIAAVCVVLAVLVYLLATRPGFVAKLVAVSRRIAPERTADAVERHIRSGASGLAVIRQPALLWRVLLSSIAQWALMTLCIYLSFEAVGIETEASAALVVLAFTVIGVSLPTSPGYVGSIQLAFVLGLTPFAVSADLALSASIYYHLLAYLSVLLVGLFFLHRFGYRFSDIKKAAPDSA